MEISPNLLTIGVKCTNINILGHNEYNEVMEELAESHSIVLGTFERTFWCCCSHPVNICRVSTSRRVLLREHS
jgi:hypothetical protein